MTTSHHLLKKVKVRRGFTVCSPITWPFTKKYDGTEKFVMTSIDHTDQHRGWFQRRAGDPVCQDPPAHGHHISFICMGFLQLWNMPERGQSLTSIPFRGSTPDYSSKLSPDVFSTRGYFHKAAGV